VADRPVAPARSNRSLIPPHYSERGDLRDGPTPGAVPCELTNGRRTRRSAS
jgi:hypothetical protein